MSHPIPRYSIDRFSRYGFVENTDGKFCEYRDYAALAADFSQMTAWGRGLETDKRLLSEKNAALAAENERLTRLLTDLSYAVHAHRANADTPRCCEVIDRIVAEFDGPQPPSH